jgi:predicted Zn-dependent protease
LKITSFDYKLNQAMDTFAAFHKKSFLIGILFLSTGSCSTSPTGRRQFKILPQAQMASMGAASFEEMEKKIPRSRNQKFIQQSKCVSQALLAVAPIQIPAEQWEVVVFEEPSPNAFALPGGKIGIHSGLFKAAQNVDQLAAVIGHEIAHVIADHGNERVSTAFTSQAGLMAASAALGSKEDNPNKDLLLGAMGLGIQFGVLMPYGRTHESEADQLGLVYLYDAGFKVEEAPKLWENMIKLGGEGPPEFLSTHPSPSNRIQQLKAWASELKGRKPKKAQRPSC